MLLLNATKPNATYHQKQKEEREGGAAQQQQFRLEQTVFKIMAKDVKVTPCDPGIKGIELDTKQKQKNPVPKEISFFHQRFSSVEYQPPLYRLSFNTGSTQNNV